MLFDLRRPVSRSEYALGTFAVLFGLHLYHVLTFSMLPRSVGTWPLAQTLSVLVPRYQEPFSNAQWLARYEPPTLVFRWLLFSLSARRAVDGGRSPLRALWTLIPVLGYLASLELFMLPPAPRRVLGPRASSGSMAQLAVILPGMALMAVVFFAGLPGALEQMGSGMLGLPALPFWAGTIAALMLLAPWWAYRASLGPGAPLGKAAIHSARLLALACIIISYLRARALVSLCEGIIQLWHLCLVPLALWIFFAGALATVSIAGDDPDR